MNPLLFYVYKYRKNKSTGLNSMLTAVTSLMAHNWSSLTFSTKKGVIPIEEIYK